MTIKFFHTFLALRVMLAIHSIMLFVGLVQAVVAITTSAFSCRTICCRKRSNAGTVIFAPVNTNIDPRFVSVTLNTHQDPVPRPETTEQLGKLYYCSKIITNNFLTLTVIMTGLCFAQ